MMYHIPLKTKTDITMISTNEKSLYDGVYSFRLRYQPHSPTRMFIVFKNTPYIFKSYGFESPIDLIKEADHLLVSIKADSSYVGTAISGLYSYLYEEYGLSYGRHFFDHRKTDFENEEEKKHYMMSKIRDMALIQNEGSRITKTKNHQYLREIIISIENNNLNSEEAIMLLQLIANVGRN